MVQTPSSPRATTARAGVQKRRILDAAFVVFRRHGVHAAGMRQIAAELGMHASNLYYYFENKGDLIAYCQEETLRELLKLANEVASLEIPSDEKLRRMVKGHVVVLNKSIPGSLAHLEIEGVAPERRAEMLSQRDTYEKTWRRIVRQGVKDGTLSSVDPKLASLALLGAVNWTVRWFQPGGRRSADYIGTQFADYLVAGLLERSD